jgi:hypothetical protein
MVLVSHRYKFIYIKNIKVAGTSVESFFEKFCVDPSKKYYFNHKANENISKYGIIGARLGGTGNKWRSHKPASNIKKDLGQQMFNKYFKFCVIRNPYDKMVSWYFWKKSKLSFKNFCKNNNCNNMKIHTINNTPVCDFYIRFENLQEDIINICKKLGITDYVIDTLPEYKSSTKRSKKNYREYYDEETRQIVFNKHRKEFEMFGYKF